MQVTWNKTARASFDAALAYGLNRFGEQSAAEFYWQIMSYEPRLAANPEMGKPEPLLADIGGNYRSLVVHEHYKLVYHIIGKNIRIADFWDTRIEPARLTRRLSKK